MLFNLLLLSLITSCFGVNSSYTVNYIPLRLELYNPPTRKTFISESWGAKKLSIDNLDKLFFSIQNTCTEEMEPRNIRISVTQNERIVYITKSLQVFDGERLCSVNRKEISQLVKIIEKEFKDIEVDRANIYKKK